MVLDSVVDWVAGRGVPFLVVFALLALMLPSVFVPVYRQYIANTANARASHRYGDPFGRAQMLDGRMYPLLKVE
jgi:hypothetical protein